MDPLLLEGAGAALTKLLQQRRQQGLVVRQTQQLMLCIQAMLPLLLQMQQLPCHPLSAPPNVPGKRLLLLLKLHSRGTGLAVRQQQQLAGEAVAAECLQPPLGRAVVAAPVEVSACSPAGISTSWLMQPLGF